MRKAFLLVFTLVYTLPLLFAQGEFDEQEKVFYRNERTFAVLFNANGLGGNFRYAKRIDAFKKTLYEVEINHVKHPKEEKVSVPSNQSINRKIVYGKQNYFVTLKGAIGIQKEMFRKHDKGSISIRYFYNFGPSIGFLKPIYYQVYLEDEYVKFEESQHANPPEVTGKAPFMKGVNEIAIRPGIYGKFGFTFEFGKRDQVFNAIEAGLSIDAYIKEVPILAYQNPQYIFPTLFLSYRFGKVIDSQFKNRKRTKVDELLIN